MSDLSGCEAATKAAEKFTAYNEITGKLAMHIRLLMFVTVWLGILEISTGKMTCANAGHEYPAVKHKDGSFKMFKDKHGIAVGAMEGIKYKEYTIELEKGDKLFVYTDGVPEATDSDMEMFGTERMIQALNHESEAGTEKLISNVRAAIRDFVKDAEQFDDLTMLCIEYK